VAARAREHLLEKKKKNSKILQEGRQVAFVAAPVRWLVVRSRQRLPVHGHAPNFHQVPDLRPPILLDFDQDLVRLPKVPSDVEEPAKDLDRSFGLGRARKVVEQPQAQFAVGLGFAGSVAVLCCEAQIAVAFAASLRVRARRTARNASCGGVDALAPQQHEAGRERLFLPLHESGHFFFFQFGPKGIFSSFFFCFRPKNLIFFLFFFSTRFCGPVHFLNDDVGREAKTNAQFVCATCSGDVGIGSGIAFANVFASLLAFAAARKCSKQTWKKKINLQ
jgi:hypothetical protein